MGNKEGNTELKKLTPKEDIFCYEYCIDFNATRAAIKAGYSKRSARQVASRLLTKDNIQARIKYLQDNLAETAGISALKVIKEHEKIAFSDAGQLRDGWISLKDFKKLKKEQKACIQEVSTKVLKKTFKEFEEGEFKDVPYEEEWVKIKLYDKQKSLDSISNMLGFNAPVKTDLSGQLGIVWSEEKTYEAKPETD